MTGSRSRPCWLRSPKPRSAGSSGLILTGCRKDLTGARLDHRAVSRARRGPPETGRPSPRLSAGIVAKTVDHLPLHRQEKIFERHGVEISRKTMGGWMGQCADLLKPLYGSLREVLAPACNIPADQRKANTNGSQRSQSATLPEILAFFSISKHFLTSIFRLRAA